MAEPEDVRPGQIWNTEFGRTVRILSKPISTVAEDDRLRLPVEMQGTHFTTNGVTTELTYEPVDPDTHEPLSIPSGAYPSYLTELVEDSDCDDPALPEYQNELVWPDE